MYKVDDVVNCFGYDFKVGRMYLLNDEVIMCDKSGGLEYVATNLDVARSDIDGHEVYPLVKGNPLQWRWIPSDGQLVYAYRYSIEDGMSENPSIIEGYMVYDSNIHRGMISHLRPLTDTEIGNNLGFKCERKD